MSHFGKASLVKLEGCHVELVDVCKLVVPHYDHTIIWGRRGEVAQNEAFATGFSTKPWPESNHNAIPPALSEAVDIAPYHTDRPHIRWDAEREFVFLAGHMMMAAAALGVSLIWGGNWRGNQDLYDRNKPFDLGHFERSK
jgi:hypothetical protein